ncbi:MAG: ABC transporter substrate-binding protein, partial [Candidatus Thorarchaeota archaeon]
MSSWKEKVLGLFVLLIFSGFIIPVQINGYSQDIHHGQHVDKIVYNIIPQDDQQVLALQNDDIDLIGQILDPTFMPMLEQAEDIDIIGTPRNGYQILNINTAKYPFNITEFRRALAFALDKERICEEVWGGYAVPQDSPLPLGNPYSAEGEIGYTYYEEDNVTGNLLLDIAGFLDVDSDGIREAPNGLDFHVLIEVPQTLNTNIETGEIIEEALHALSIDATCVPTDFYEYLNRLYFHGDYDTVLLTEDFDNMDIDWFAYEFWSLYADEPYWNSPNWENASFDYWRDFLLTATTFEGVYNAALEMQKIWIHSSPAIIIGQNEFLSAFRNDRFEGFVNSVQDGVPGWWTNYKVHLKDELGGPYGGTLRWSSGLDIDSFNFMVTSSEYSRKVHMELYDSLMKQDP